MERGRGGARRQDSKLRLWHYIEKPTVARLYIRVFPYSLQKVAEKVLKMGEGRTRKPAAKLWHSTSTPGNHVRRNRCPAHVNGAACLSLRAGQLCVNASAARARLSPGTLSQSDLA
jgi:hypothetical protein